MTVSDQKVSAVKNRHCDDEISVDRDIAVDDSEVPEYLRSRLRLFLSIDLVGSTALKQGPIARIPDVGSERKKLLESGARWRGPMLEFYQRFQHLFAQKWLRASKILNELTNADHVESPKLWKAAGDELIYSQSIVDSYQVCLAVRAWMYAARLFRLELRDRFPSLDIKMTAWVAGFPVINTEVVLEPDPEKVLSEDSGGMSDVLSLMLRKLKNYYNEKDEEKSKPFLDFIGPSMDIGFRLCSLSSQRQMPISVELAFILASVRKHLVHKFQHIAQDHADVLDKLAEFAEPKLRYLGRKELKGVLDGRMYPVFWLDTAMDDKLENAEDAIINRHDVSSDLCINLVNSFIKDVNNSLLVCQPYIEGDKSGVLPSDKPLHHGDMVKAWLAEFDDATKVERELRSSETEGITDIYVEISPSDVNIL